MLTLLKHTMTVLTILASPSAALTAQNPAEAAASKSRIEKIVEESNGNVSIEIDDELLERIMSTRHQQEQTARQTSGAPRGQINKTSGFRIQVFSDGRNQHTLEARAKARGSAILAKFPKYRGQVYSFSKSPNWYTRVGNFRTAAEASAALAELKRAFPAFASEMRTVKCQIVVVR